MDATIAKTQVGKTSTLFDHYPEDVFNLQIGTPSIPLLKMAAEIMKTASADRLVGVVYN